MKRVFIYILLIFISTEFCYSKDVQDTTNLLKFRPDENIFENRPYVYGWFPYTRISKLTFGWEIRSTNTMESCSGLQNTPFYDTGYPFKSGLPIKDEDDLRILKPGGNSENDDDYREEIPAQDGKGYLLIASYTTKNIPLNLQFAIGYSSIASNLYSLDKTKSFLNNNGVKKDFKELNILNLEQQFISSSFTAKIPLWGGAMDVFNVIFSSNYYFSTGLNFDYAFANDITQYSQIVSNKNEIRYNNRTDTLNFIYEKQFDAINKYRFSLDFGLGMRTDIGGLGLDLEFFYQQHLNNVMTGESWKNNIYGFKAAFFFDILD